jgi:DNA-directed RNA polymerase subunit M/transcription elongation factor TFIIS
MVDIAAALATAGQAINILNELNRVDRQLDQATLHLRIAELTSALASTQMTLTAAQQELSAKDQKIAELTNSFQDASELIEYDGFRYRKGADGKPCGRAYCPKCYRQGILMMTVPTTKPDSRACDCPECGGSYEAIELSF